MSNTNAAQFKKVAVKMPKVDRTSKATQPGSRMTFTVTLQETSGAKLSAAGFDTDGIVSLKGLKGQAQDRNLQFAAYVAGMTYQSLLKVSYMRDSEYGTIAQRRK